jgi:hypothetical protein
LAAIVWKFGQTFNLDFNTSGSVLGWLIFLAVAIFALIKLEPPFRVWPLEVGAFYACWWPALDHWASQRLEATAYVYGAEATNPIWWDTEYAKWGGLILIVGLGYLLQKLWDDRN